MSNWISLGLFEAEPAAGRSGWKRIAFKDPQILAFSSQGLTSESLESFLVAWKTSLPPLNFQKGTPRQIIRAAPPTIQASSGLSQLQLVAELPVVTWASVPEGVKPD